MKKILTTLSLCLAMVASPALAHHPAEDIVDPEIYAMIDAMVADTPHADLVFDDMGGATITADSVSAAEDLIDDGLLADLYLLTNEDDDEGDVTVTISFGDYVEEESQNGNNNRWTEDEWGSEVIFTIEGLACTDEIPAGEFGGCPEE